MTRSIEIHNLSKRYRLGSSQHGQMLRERLVEFMKHPLGGAKTAPESIWALQDVSFNVEEGEVVGIIGRNGAGKSTLLKVLSKITYPTSGTVKVNGRVASLLEVGTGFHDELTGRENIYLNGSILGMRKREVDQRFDAIVAFSGVEQFLDTPIKRYSSGMRLRLGFSVAAHLEPDVLIVDEVLAVGDAEFQKKCLATMEGLRRSGRTVLFVSHNLAAVENLCTRGIWIEAGKIRMDGAARDVLSGYMGSFAGKQPSGFDLSRVEERLGSGEIRYTRLEYLDKEGKPCTLIRSGDSVVIRLYYHAKKPITYPSFGFRLFTHMGTLVTAAGNIVHGLSIPQLDAGDGYIDVEIDTLNLLPARYSLSLWITEPSGTPIFDGDVRADFEVEPASIFLSGHEPTSRFGIVYFPQRWRITQA